MSKPLTTRAKQVLDYLQAKGRATARDALLDIDINSGSFTRRMTEIRDAGYAVRTDSHRHPTTNRLYRSYTYLANEPVTTVNTSSI